MDFIVQNSDKIFFVVIYIATIVGYGYCVYFIDSVRRKGAEEEKQIVRESVLYAFNIVLGMFAVLLVLALLVYILGGFGLINPIRLSESGFPLIVSGLIPFIFYNTYSYRKRLLKAKK